VPVPPYLPDTREVREAIARQYDNIAHNDKIVGRLLEQLEEDGLAGNTLVFLWSDHGEGLPRAKRFLYDSGIRVPLILRWPGRIEAGRTDERLVSLIDLAPTVLDAAGLACPLHIEGYSLLRPPGRSHAFAHRDRLDGDYDKARAVRSSRFKYIRNYYPGRERFGCIPYREKHDAMRAIRLEQLRGNPFFDQPCPPEELYDLESDPFEVTNLAGDPAYEKERRELVAALRAWQLENDPDRDLGEEQMIKRLWPDNVQPATATPVAILHSEDHPEAVIVSDEIEVSGVALLQLTCATEGASMGYREEGEERWTLYRRALRLTPGRYALRLKAVRYGYLESEESVVRILVKPEPLGAAG
jgi:hypothetical protein